ncbi:Hypothetical predicted protein [Lecanosticta acicola]|uniref:DRBM domain-containing protein n=1 Tax=Lecanosticta acicola TaxID=111012 RepID=A0AAI8Z1F6_9PEZI|nr:Hypothetical predicted protein [Lecanosticta acicola]
MFYTMYLSSVCQRRQWPEPHYEPVRTRTGYYCKVRVNNREYSTEVPYASEALARDGAAQKAYMICRNFSVNDGMFPGQRPGGRNVQGLPVAIGTGRKRNSAFSEGSSTSSGGSSPRSIPDSSGFDDVAAVRTQPKPTPQQKRGGGGGGGGGGDGYMCYCRRGAVRAYGRCGWCLRESGWT